ncbi:RNA 2',3'-cyclic phosphodiesterase [Paenibacillus pinistramenti]|uniref:RNA 2',3'-cyclic phosphodiesterase n=1 Tax=Paenibacillus pinistramenti TaxID=1768003 RepID=UPI001EF12B0E|nr:RNA 2',3'-cyclic phosphodiesterase [Paenibacillus pinistramenti]
MDTSHEHFQNSGTDASNEQREQAPWRLFAAVPLPAEIKQRLDAWCREQRGRLKFQKWVFPEDYHITVQFLGDVAPPAVPGIEQALHAAAAATAPFELGLSGTGIFGRPESPRVLWAAVTGERDKLAHLHETVVSALEPLGFVPEQRPYSPHVTLARKSAHGASFDGSILDQPSDFGVWQADSVVLYRTRMGRQPMYEAVAQVRFGI